MVFVMVYATSSRIAAVTMMVVPMVADGTVSLPLAAFG
jgi:hypothetical protein